MLTCGDCGFAIVTERKTKQLKSGKDLGYVYCRCSNKRKDYQCKRKSIYVREEKFIQQVKNELSKFTIDQEFFELAIECLAQEDDLKSSEQTSKIKWYEQQIAKKNDELTGLRRMRYSGELTDQSFFLNEQANIEKDIEQLNIDRDKVFVNAHNWRETANDVFMFARYAQEDFDGNDWEKKRTVIKRLGAELKVVGRTIQFTPNKYFVEIEKAYPELKAEFDLVRTLPQQRN